MTVATRNVPCSDTAASLPTSATDWQNIVNANIAILWRYIAAPLVSIGGTTNDITAASDTSVVGAITSYQTGQKFSFIPAFTNTGGMTINIDGQGVKSLLNADGSTIQGGTVAASQIILIEYSGTAFRLLASGSALGGSGSTAPDAIFQDQKSAGTQGGTFTSGAFQTRTLNTSARNTIAGCSLSANQITLQAGTYYFEWSAPANQVNSHQTRIQNITDATTAFLGTSELTLTSDGQNRSFGVGVVSISTAKVFELQHRCETTKTTSGFGDGLGVTTEVYSTLSISKVGQLASQVNGVPGGAITFPMLFSTTTTDSDPGSGTLRLNNATLGSVSQMFIDLLDANFSDVTTVLDQLQASTSSVAGMVRLVKYDDPTKWVDFVSSIVTTASGYRKLNVAVFASSTGGASIPFANGDRVFFCFSRTGDRGDIGTIRYYFSTTTTMADPGVGQMRINNAAFGSVTALALSVNVGELFNPSAANFIKTWDDSTNAAKGYIRIVKQAAPWNYAIYQLNSLTDNTTWIQLAVSAIDSAGAFGNGDQVGIEFSRTGDTGSSFTAATQAEQEAGTDLTHGVTPGRQQFHASACKAWVEFNGTGTLAVNASYNVSSVTDNGTGSYNPNFTTAFSSAFNAHCANSNTSGTGTGAGNTQVASPTSINTTDYRLVVSDNNADNLGDGAVVSSHSFGDQ